MYAGVVHKPFDIRYEQIETPQPQAGEILVKVKYTGICGSDLPRVNGNACHFFPIVLGHEFSGTVTAVGEGVTQRKVGDRVAGVPLVPCMECEDCKKGNYSLCRQYSFIGSRRNGSFAEYIALPTENTVLIGQTTDFEAGAFFEPATVALHGMRLAEYVPGKSVAIVGAGTIGSLTIQWCRIFGARNIVVFNRGTQKRERSLALGANAYVDTEEETYLQNAHAVNGGQNFDFVFETAGTAQTIKIAFSLGGNHSHVCMIGTPKSDVNFSIAEWEQLNRKEMYATGSWMSYSAPFPGSEWIETAHFIETGELKLDRSLIFRVIPLSQIREAFEMFRTPGVVKGKVLIDSEK